MPSEPDASPVVHYKPSAYYYRKALREAETVNAARCIGLAVVDELESLKQWVREQGMIPPKFRVLAEEAKAKGWGAEAG